MTWDDYVSLAFDEIRLSGAGSPQVARRLQAALLDLRSVVPPERAPAVDEQLQLLERQAAARLEEDRDVRLALSPDGQGIGVAGDGARAVGR